MLRKRVKQKNKERTYLRVSGLVCFFVLSKDLSEVNLVAI